MPADDILQIRIPSAIELEPIEDQEIAVRTFYGQIFVRRNAYFRYVRLLQIDYSPAWAKVEAAFTISDIEMQRIAGVNGVILTNWDITDMEPFEYQLYNTSIDTAVRFTLRFRGWQVHEG